jgi:hypothetical protein
MSPRQRPCVLTSRYCTHISNHTRHHLAKDIDVFTDEIRYAEAGPAPAFLDELPNQDPVPNHGRAAEVLRQLAILYLHDRNSQVAGIGMEPSQANEVMVVITLRLTNL